MKINKIILFTLFITVSTGVFAQGASDALFFSQNQYEGTARTMAMGNAFTALGGDIGAITINPASSGVFRRSQFSFTPSIISATGVSDYLDMSNRDSKSKLALSNFGFVGTFDTGNYSGLLNWNLGIAYNRTNSYNSRMHVSGATSSSSALASLASGLTGIDYLDLEKSDQYDPFRNSNVSWLEVLGWNTYLLSTLPGTYDEYLASTENIDEYGNIGVGGELLQDYTRQVTGGSSEFNINFGGNISDFLYFGTSLNLTSITYNVSESYSEMAVIRGIESPFQDGFESYYSKYWQNTTGAGVNLKFGVILTPVGGLRIGATFTTPTWYSMTDTWDRSMYSSFNNGNSYSEYSPTGSYDYMITTPMRASLGIAYTFGSFALLSADYEYVDYSTIKMRDYQGRSAEFDEDNQYIRNNYGISNIFRIGAEIRPTSRLSLRGGYNYYGTPGDGYANIQYATAGLGVKLGRSIALDFAYQKRLTTSESFALYNDYGDQTDPIQAPVGTFTSNSSKWVVTFALSF